MRRRARIRSGGHSASWSRSTRRSLSVSTTSSGARKRSSIFSRRPRSSPRLRSCSCAWLARSCSSGADLAGRDAAGAAHGGRGRRADPELRCEADVGDRIARAAGGNPLFITEMLAMARERTDVEVPGYAPGTARRAARPARRLGTACARARLGRGRALPSRRCAGARSRGGSCDGKAHRARAARAPPSRSAAVRRRGCVPLPAPPDQGRRLRCHAEERSGRAPRALRRVAGTERDTSGARRDCRLPPRARYLVSRGARPTG